MDVFPSIPGPKVVKGQPLIGHITPDVVVFNLPEFPGILQIPAKVGDIIVYSAEDVPSLGSAVLLADITRQ